MTYPSSSQEYRAWSSMRQRCRNPNCQAYKNYGARGITVAAEWDTFGRFMADMGAKPTPSHCLDRIDNDGGYSRANCRWTTVSQNNRNRRFRHMIEVNGETLNLCEWANRSGLSASLILTRLKAGWPPDEAISAPPNLGARVRFLSGIESRRRYRASIDGVPMSIADACAKTGVPYACAMKRVVTYKWSPDRAVSEAPHPRSKPEAARGQVKSGGEVQMEVWELGKRKVAP